MGSSRPEILGAYLAERLSVLCLPPKLRPGLFRTSWCGAKRTRWCSVYSLTAGFPKQETYGLALQMRRAAVSVPANIAEGFRRRGKADKARYMNMAEASLEESRYYL